jgi:hypothetical protein
VRVLREHGKRLGLPPRFTICDSADQLSAVKSAMRELRVHETTMHPSALLARISLGKNRLESAEALLQNAEGGRDQLVGSVWQRYREHLGRTRTLDFDDLLLETLRPPERARGRPSPLPRALPPRAGRRVPGHERAPVRDRASDRRRAPQRVRGGRRSTSRSYGLARRRHPEDPRLRPRFRGRAGS